MIFLVTVYSSTALETKLVRPTLCTRKHQCTKNLCRETKIPFLGTGLSGERFGFLEVIRPQALQSPGPSSRIGKNTGFLMFGERESAPPIRL